ncbi:MAG TPA: IS200/IS605 family transposase [Ktedonobacteraceae bacterium]|nr:IS200/IS605 family transposase [Ktedonobacteraceae bacterium]
MREVDRSNNTVFFRFISFVVWCPNYRRSVLLDGVDIRLKEIITQTCDAFHALIQELKVMPDQVHLLVSVDPPFGMHRFVKVLKGRSSRFLRQEFSSLVSPRVFPNSSFVATAGGAPLEIVKQSIKEQKYV